MTHLPQMIYRRRLARKAEVLLNFARGRSDSALLLRRSDELQNLLLAGGQIHVRANTGFR